MRSSDEHAATIAERTATTWFAKHGSGDIEIPLSVVAVLAMINPLPQRRGSMAADLIAFDVDGFTGLMRHLWGTYVVEQPHLAVPTWPLIEPWWSKTHPAGQGRREAARDVAHVVLRAGVFALDYRSTDLLGTVLTLLRPPVALQRQGQYYTSSDICDVLVSITGATPDVGESVYDPTCGTGGILRAAAQAMRQQGRDPAQAIWVGNDTDPLAVAGLAVNTYLWGLGHQVLLGVGDSLTDDWQPRALAERDEVMGAWRAARMVAALNDLTRSLDT